VFSGAQLSVLIRQVVKEELLTHPQVQAMQNTATGSGPSTIQSPLDLAGHAMQMRSQLDQHKAIHFGQTYKYDQWNPHTVHYHPGVIQGGGLAVLEGRARMGAQGGPLDRVHIPGSSGAYPHLAHTALPGLMASTGMNDRQLAEQMRLFSQTGNTTVPMSRDQLSMLGSTSHLIFGTESARNTGALITGPMSAHLTETGQLKWQQTLAPLQSPQLHMPMARAGAPAASRGLENLLKDQTGVVPRAGGFGSQEAASGMAASEEQLIIAWVLQVTGSEAAASSEESIRMLVRTFVRDWYRLHSRTRH